METKTLALSDNRKLEITNYLKSFQASILGSEIQKALALTEQGFDPFLHLVVYQGKVTTTIDALYWWADGKGQAYRVISKPIKAEEKESYGVGENEIGVIASLYVGDASEPSFTGFGRASKDARAPVMRGSAVEHQHPYRMAEKRAEAQVLRKFRALSTSVLIQEEAIESEAGEAEVVEKKKPVSGKPTVVKVEEETPEPGGARIDLVWLRESLQRIQAKKVKGWDTESLLRYLRSFGIEGEKVSELVSQLTKEQAEQFTGMVQETLSIL